MPIATTLHNKTLRALEESERELTDLSRRYEEQGSQNRTLIEERTRLINDLTGTKQRMRDIEGAANAERRSLITANQQIIEMSQELERAQKTVHCLAAYIHGFLDARANRGP